MTLQEAIEKLRTIMNWHEAVGLGVIAKDISGCITIIEKSMQKIPHEWKLVPIEPTNTQVGAAYSNYLISKNKTDIADFIRAYKVMVLNSPLPPSDCVQNIVIQTEG